MLTNPNFICTRRDWLLLGGLGAFGLSLPGLLRAEKSSGKAPAARSCVLFLLHGGPSQLDTWDMKPAAPVEVRGEFKPIATSLPGVQVCEHLPRLARMMGRLCLIRAVSHRYNSHNPYGVMTGFDGGNDRENYFAK